MDKQGTPLEMETVERIVGRLTLEKTVLADKLREKDEMIKHLHKELEVAHAKSA